MIREIHSFEPYIEFIHQLSSDPCFSDPHYTYDRDNLYTALQKENQHAFTSSDGEQVNGLFVFLILPEEKFIEMIIGLSESESAITEMLTFLAKKYRRYQIDFVVNPEHPIFMKLLIQKHAQFGKEQQRMVQNGIVPHIPTDHVILYESEYREQYCRMHRKDTYWTAEKVLAAAEKFRVFLALEKQTVIGYLDVTYCYDENEPYDLYVKSEYEHRGFEEAMIAKAIQMNRPNGMMVLVDVDAEDEIQNFENAGFQTIQGQNSIYASYRL